MATGLDLDVGWMNYAFLIAGAALLFGLVTAFIVSVINLFIELRNKLIELRSKQEHRQEN